MNQNRRELLKAGGGTAVMVLAASAGLLGSESAFAQEWNKTAFEGKSLNEVVKALGGMTAAESKDISFFNTADIAESGATVSVGVISKLPRTETIAILVEKNPAALSANFTIPDGTESTVLTRVKMAQTSNVYALVKADGKYLYAVKEVKVTLGGCGG